MGRCVQPGGEGDAVQPGHDPAGASFPRDFRPRLHFNPKLRLLPQDCELPASFRPEQYQGVGRADCSSRTQARLRGGV